MRATTIVAVAIGIYTLGRWSHGKDAVTIGSVVGFLVLMVSIGMLDHGKSAEAALGFAWIILAVALLSPDSPIGPIAKLTVNTLDNTPVTPDNGGKNS